MYRLCIVYTMSQLLLIQLNSLNICNKFRYNIISISISIFQYRFIYLIRLINYIVSLLLCMHVDHNYICICIDERLYNLRHL